VDFLKYLHNRRHPWIEALLTTHSHMHPLTLLAEQHQVLDLLAVRTAEPVRHARVELGDLAGNERQVVRAQHQAQISAQHVEPLEALVRTGPGNLHLPGRRDHLLERADGGRLPSEWNRDHPATPNRSGCHPRILHRGSGYQLIQREAVCLRQRNEQLESRLAQPGLEPRQGADRDPGG
jgi:hypothetical protein